MKIHATFTQRILAKLDKFISEKIGLESSGNTHGNKAEWSFFYHFGPRIAIIDSSGKVRRLTGFFAIRHEYVNDTLIRRIPERRNLKKESVLQHDPKLNNFNI